MREIDPATAAGAALLAAVRATEGGERLASLVPHLGRAFFLDVPAAPGLHFAGAEIDAARLGNGRPAQRFALAGDGESDIAALVACLGEGAERVAQVEMAGDVVRTAPLAAVASRVMPAALAPVAALLGDAPGRDVDWIPARAWPGPEQPPLSSGTDDQPMLVPADWCLRRAAPGPLTMPDTPLSTGAAAGRDRAMAATRALLELIERDAAALWWIGGRHGRTLAADSAVMADCVPLLGRLRAGAARRTTWLLDITSDLEVPVVAALSMSSAAGRRGLAVGLSARLSASAAARAAILELVQMELGLELALGRLRQRGREGLGEADRRHLARAGGIDPERCELLWPRGMARAKFALERFPSELGRVETDEGDASALVAQLGKRGIATAFVDLTRTDIAVPVVKALAPALQLMPGGVPTARLASAIAETGGGARHTGGAPLM